MFDLLVVSASPRASSFLVILWGGAAVHKSVVFLSCPFARLEEISHMNVRPFDLKCILVQDPCFFCEQISCLLQYNLHNIRVVRTTEHSNCDCFVDLVV